MGLIQVKGIRRKISLVVFDKDGLMFQSQPFWAGIGNERIARLKETLNEEQIAEWARIFGLTMKDGLVTYCDPKGILAVAAPREEIAVTAGLMVKDLGIAWAKALEMASDVFRRADEEMDLAKALVPRKGFPEIFERLRFGGIPYAIATSDTMGRVIASLEMFGEKLPDIVVVPEMVERGKPAPDMLIKAAELAGVPVEETAMIGDSYVDVKMAKDAGGFGIGIPETEEMRASISEYTDAVIESLDDIEIL